MGTAVLPLRHTYMNVSYLGQWHCRLFFHAKNGKNTYECHEIVLCNKCTSSRIVEAPTSDKFISCFVAVPALPTLQSVSVQHVVHKPIT